MPAFLSYALLMIYALRSCNRTQSNVYACWKIKRNEKLVEK